MVLLGIDGGGTKTVGLLGTEHGEILARAEGGSANYHLVGVEGVETTLRGLLALLCADIGGVGNVDDATVGLAGVARPDDHATIRPVLERLGFPARTLLTHDARIALAGGVGKDAGVILIAGTGSMAYGRAFSGEESRCGGWGQFLGDEGSGYALGLDALRVIARATDGRTSPTLLTDRVLTTLDLPRPEMLIRWTQAASKAAIAALAPCVFETAEKGDASARALLRRGADGLSELAVTVLRRLEWTETPSLALSGGLFAHYPMYRESVTQRVLTAFQDVSITAPLHEPAYGALLLARQQRKESA